MSLSTQHLNYSRKLMQAGVAGVLGFSTLTIALPAQALNFSFTGDVATNGGITTITNAFNDGSDDNGVNFNVSRNNPVGIGDLETALGVPQGTLDSNPTEGSAIFTDLLVNAGDTFSFNYNFFSNDTVNADYGFVTVLFGSDPAQLFKLASAPSPAPGFSSSFSYSFAAAGSYQVGIDVVDVEDTVASLVLNVSDATLTPVPTPAMLPGLIGFGLTMLRKRKSEAQ